MAASSSSDESSKAPGNFHVHDDACDVIEDHSGVCYLDAVIQNESVSPLMKCPLCCTLQTQFYCRICVKNGSFSYSSAPSGESLLEQQQKYLNVQAGLKELSNCYERLISAKKSCENRQFEIKHKKEEIKLLKKLIASKRSKLQELSSVHSELRHANAEKRRNLPKYPIKVKELEDYVLDRIEKINHLREKNQLLHDRLKQTRRQSIQQLVQYIFPISEVVLKDEIRCRMGAAVAGTEPQAERESDTVAALADAKNTSYIRGKWVFHGSGISEMQYRIVAPSLPANGDYSAYLDWLSDNKDDVPKTAANEIAPSRVPGFRIVGALTYTTQLTNLMSYYLNVRLPHKIAYGDFCKKLNEEQFLRRVSRLNANIMYLAYTQQVKLSTLNENHTLENLLTLLDVEKSDLGRQGHNEVANAPLLRSIDSLLLGIETATESESEDESSLRLDWEAVPSLPNPPEMATSNLLTPAAAQQSTIAEGLMTSAANRITSILRWMK